jgi:hypothetical protein
MVSKETARIVVALCGSDGKVIDATAITFGCEVECVDVLQWQMAHTAYGIHGSVVKMVKAISLARAMTAPSRWAARGTTKADRAAFCGNSGAS